MTHTIKPSKTTHTTLLYSRDTTTIRIQLFNSSECLLDTHDVTITNRPDGEENDASAALIKLLRHSWILAAGDVIRINEV